MRRHVFEVRLIALPFTKSSCTAGRPNHHASPGGGAEYRRRLPCASCLVSGYRYDVARTDEPARGTIGRNSRCARRMGTVDWQAIQPTCDEAQARSADGSATTGGRGNLTLPGLRPGWICTRLRCYYAAKGLTHFAIRGGSGDRAVLRDAGTRHSGRRAARGEENSVCCTGLLYQATRCCR